MSSNEPLFPEVSATERFYERATVAGLLLAVCLWLPLWAAGPLSLLGLDLLWKLIGGTLGAAALYATIVRMERSLDPAEISFTWLPEVIPTARSLLRLAMANLWMGFLLPVLTFHLVVWSPGFADEQLVAFDNALGLDHYAWVVWTLETGLRTPLVWVYNSLWTQSVVVMLWLVLVARSTERLWGMTVLSVWGGLLSLPLFFYYPALG